MKLVISPVASAECKALISELDLADIERGIMIDYALHSTHCWTVRVDGILICVFGLIAQTLACQSAYLWVYNTSEYEPYRFVFARHSQEVLDEMLKHYPVIIGHCVRSNKSAQRWLKWLGAKFSAHEGNLIPFEVRAR